MNIDKKTELRQSLYIHNFENMFNDLMSDEYTQYSNN